MVAVAAGTVLAAVTAGRKNCNSCTASGGRTVIVLAARIDDAGEDKRQLCMLWVDPLMQFVLPRMANFHN
jgi:hypothetical protein